jgi:cytochrome c oxidase subunit 2
MTKTVASMFALLAIASMPALRVLPNFNPSGEKTIRVTAKRFEFSPSEIHLKKGEPVVLEIQSADVRHGFNLPDLGVRADLKPGTVSRISFTPNKTGEFAFTCDVFCGSGHEDMSGTVSVSE